MEKKGRMKVKQTREGGQINEEGRRAGGKVSNNVAGTYTNGKNLQNWVIRPVCVAFPRM